MYKLIALDLDGTLTDKNKNILEENNENIEYKSFFKEIIDKIF